MDVTHRLSTRTGFWAVLWLSVLAWAPTTFPGYWQSLDGFIPIFNAARADPLANIATAPDLWRGTGSGAFLLVPPLLLLGLDNVAAVRVIFALSFVLGGLGIYVWLQTRLGDRAAGLAGLLYMFLPPFLATIYVRGSLSDSLLLGLLPLALAGVASHAESRSVSAASVVVLTMLWMWRTQAGLAVFATLFLLAYTIFVERQQLTLWVVLLSGAAGLTSLLPLWSVNAPAPVNFQDHFVYLFQLFKSSWQVAPSIAGWQDGYPFQLGFAALTFSVVTLWLWRLTPQLAPQPVIGRLLGFSFIGIGLIVLLILGISEPLWRLSGAERLLTYPWQLLLLAGPLLAVTAGSLPVLQRDLNEGVYWSILLTLVVLSSYNDLTTRFTQVQPPETPVAIVGPHDNFVVLAAHLTESSQPRAATLEVTWQALHPLSFDDNVFFQALSGDDTSPVMVAQLDRQPHDSKSAGGERPATTWQPGEILTDTYRLDLSTVPQVKNLRYYFGYYDWRDGVRLPVDDGLDDKLVFHGH